MSEFHAKSLTGGDPPPPPTPSSRTSKRTTASAGSKPQKGIQQQISLAHCFPPMYQPQAQIICHPPRAPSKTPCFSSHHFFGFLLFNIFLACIFVPIIAVHTTVYLLPVNTDLYSNLIPGFNLTKMQLIGIIVFVCADIFLYLTVYFTANYSSIFYGCSTDMGFKIFSGTQFIPVILVIKLLQPLTIIGEQDMTVDVPFIWALRFALCLLIFVSIMPLIFAEVSLFRGVTGMSNGSYQDSYKTPPLIKNKHKAPTYFFFLLKLVMLFCFLLEMAVINFGIISPVSIDYPLIFSTANLIFVFYSHRPVIAKYHVLETGRTAITSEFGCLDGRRCCNKYRPNQLLTYERSEISFIQASSCEYTFYSETELPKWLQYKIAKFHKKVAAFNSKIAKY